MVYPVKTIRQLQPILKAFRKVKGLTQGELAQEIGVSQQALSSLESKPHRASFERLLTYLFAVDVEIVLRERKSSAQTSSAEW